jgi:hypothetical protein
MSELILFNESLYSNKTRAKTNKILFADIESFILAQLVGNNLKINNQIK